MKNIETIANEIINSITEENISYGFCISYDSYDFKTVEEMNDYLQEFKEENPYESYQYWISFDIDSNDFCILEDEGCEQFESLKEYIKNHYECDDEDDVEEVADYVVSYFEEKMRNFRD